MKRRDANSPSSAWPGLRQLAEALWAWQLVALIGTLLLLLSLAALMPRSYQIAIGQEDGLGGDLPLLTDFNTPEHDSTGDFRWTNSESTIRLPGLGSRPLELRFRTIPINAELAANGPQAFTLSADGRVLGSAAVRPRGGIYRLLVPASTNISGDQAIIIRSATLVPTGDQRTLGIGLDRFTITAGPGTLPLRSSLLWVAALICAWLAMRWAGYSAPTALLLLLPTLPALGLAALLDPPRFAFGAEPILLALGLASLLALALARMGGRFTQFIPPHTWRALCLLAAGTFALRYGGKIYPNAMPGDLGFHINRFADTLRGTVFLVSKNRGVDFPYPPALYLLLAPLSLAFERGVALQLSAALLDAISPIFVAVVAVRSQLVRSWRAGIAAGSIYALCGAGFMPTWWNFSTHIFAQFTHLVLVSSVILIWPLLSHTKHGPSWRLGLCLMALQLFVYLGHFGFWINTSLLGGLGGAALVFWGRAPQAKKRLAVLLGSFVLAQLIAILIFYSGYSALLVEQISRTASGGLTQLAGRAPISPHILWQTLRDGLYAHIGLFPIPLALAALLTGPGQTHARTLIGFTFLIGLGFAILPFVSGSTLATRWLMFSIWAIAIGSVSAAERFWRAGRAGQLSLVVIGCFVFCISAALWLGALAWRFRPPEQF